MGLIEAVDAMFDLSRRLRAVIFGLISLQETVEEFCEPQMANLATTKVYLDSSWLLAMAFFVVKTLDF